MSLIKDPSPQEVQCAVQTFSCPQLAQATDDQNTLFQESTKKKKKSGTGQVPASFLCPGWEGKA